MSAILGIFQRDKKPVSRSELENMNNALSHRGKDGSGAWINGAVGFGHQMHWITPESLTEKLPYYNSSSKLAITADARIDNRNELFAKLAVPKGEQNAMADSLLILLAYEKWGENCANFLIGDYVFAILDDRNQKIFCATDPLGNRPVYYYLDEKLFAFASEIKALLTLPPVPKQLNEAQFARNIMFELSLQESEATCFKGIVRIKAGHTITVTEKRTWQTTHGQPDFNKKLQLKNDAEYIEAFREILDEAIHCRMRSAYPVTCLLSGGLDSSSIASIAAKKLLETNTQLVCLAGMLPDNHEGPEKDERYYIEQVRDRWNIHLEQVSHPQNGIYENIEQVCRRVEHPHVDTRHYQYQAFQAVAAKHNSRIILDGYGGELSASSYGRGYYSELLMNGKWSLLAKELRDQSNIDNISVPSMLLKQVLRPFAPSWLEQAYYKYKHGNNIAVANSAVRPEFSRRMKLNRQVKVIEDIFKIHPSVNKNNKILYDLNKSETFRLYDARDSQMLYPYLDKRLLEFCFSIPTRLKVNKGWKRYLIRTGMEGLLPTEVQWRNSKLPFSPDHASRIKASEFEAQKILASVSKDEAIRDYIDIPRLCRLLEELSKIPVLSEDDVYALNSRASLVQTGIYAIVFSRVFPEIF